MRIVARNVTELIEALGKVKSFCKRTGYPIEIKANKASSKRMAQLGGMFGVWIKEISQETGESQNDIHARLKKDFLMPVYFANPVGNDQDTWVELAAHYQTIGDQEKLVRHLKRISLVWARVTQMSDYMNAVWEECTSNGIFLSPLEKDR